MPSADASRLAAQWSRGAASGSRGNSAASHIAFALIQRATNTLDEERHLLGHGGSCRVFDAEIGGYAVAIKVMNDQGQESPDARKLAAWLDQQVKAEIADCSEVCDASSSTVEALPS